MSTTTWVYSMLQSGRGAWSKYIFNYNVDAFALLGDTLYLRYGDYVNVVDSSYTSDFTETTETLIDGEIQWPWLDMSMPGVTKMLESFDIVATATVLPFISFGYDQLAAGTFSTPYEIPADSLTGTMIPMPLSAPSLAPKVTWASGNMTFYGLSMYVHDNRAGS
jgi:hypothetical protein